MEELNRKLAEWAGFQEFHYHECEGGIVAWSDEKGERAWLDFTESLDACFKWLVPKLTYLLRMTIRKIPDGYQWQIDRERGHISEFVIGEGATESLALCKAIEKLY